VLTFFRLPAFTGANAAAGLMNFGVMGMLFAMSLFFQHAQGLSAAQAGLRLSLMFLPFVVLVSSADGWWGDWALAVNRRTLKETQGRPKLP
jgi:hypothetical protein